MMAERPRVLVTGGAGYIGSHTCKALARAGLVPVAYDSLVTGNPWAAKWGALVVGDVADNGLLAKAIRDHGISSVVHFAASCYVGESMRDPGLYFQNNIGATLGLLDAMVHCGVTELVFSSSCAVYGIPTSVPIAEDHVTCPVNPYGESKLACERIISWYGEVHGIKCIRFRYFNAAGADPECDIGEWHDPETHLIPNLLNAAETGKAADVFGHDLATPDGTAVRDFVHVSDLADAHVRALSRLRDGGGAGIYNLGTRKGCSVRDVLRACEEATGRAIAARDRPPREGDPPTLVADPGKACRELGWRPVASSIENIVQTAWRWHQHMAHSHPASQPISTRWEGR